MEDRVLIRTALFACAVLFTLVLAVSFATERRDKQKAAVFAVPVVDESVAPLQQPRITTRSSR